MRFSLRRCPGFQSPHNRTTYLQKKANHLHARQVDLEVIEAELKRQRQDFAWQQTAHPLSNNDDGHTGAPSSLYFPRTVYNMAAVACHLEDISDTSDSKTNEQLNQAKQLLRVTLE
jgi:hypothetical protein